MRTNIVLFTADVGSLYGGPLLIHVFFVKVLYLLGAMSLSMALQLDRHGLWNLLGPSLFALGIMAVAWVRATVLFLSNNSKNKRFIPSYYI